MLGVTMGATVGVVLYVALSRELPGSGIRFARVPRLARRAGGLAARATIEEIFWRWFVLGRAAVLVGAAPALVVSTVGFALAHRYAGWDAVAVHLLTGAVFGGVYLVAGGLWPAVVAHIVYNLLVDAAVEGR
jgi:hypothetical protein